MGHVEQPEGDRQPDADGCIEAAEQHAEHHCVTQQVDRKHLSPLPARPLVPAFRSSRAPRCTHLSRTSESYGHKQTYDASAAFDLKSLIVFAACAAGTSNRRHWA